MFAQESVFFSPCKASEGVLKPQPSRTASESESSPPLPPHGSVTVLTPLQWSPFHSAT